MRRMRTESIYESGVWELLTGATTNNKVLRDLEKGYQYKIYLNVKGIGSFGILRIQSEIGASADYINYMGASYYTVFNLGSNSGGVFTGLVTYKNANALSITLGFTGTLTSDVKFRYLITRQALEV